MRRFSGSREEMDIARYLGDASRSISAALGVARKLKTPRSRAFERDLARIISMMEGLGNISGPDSGDPDLASEETHAERQRAAREKRNAERAAMTKVETNE